MNIDEVFAKCVDVISLAGRAGIPITECIKRVDPNRPRLAKWLYKNCKKRSPDFQVNGEDFDTASVVASEALRRRALGYHILEHAPLQPQAWDLLEAVGQAGKNGALQSQLSKDLNLDPVLLHHYLGSLLALKLVVRRRIVITAQKSGASTSSVANVTQTCVLALARYAAFIGSCTADARPNGVTLGQKQEQAVVHNLNLEERTEKIIELLQAAPGGVMPERDIKMQIIPEGAERNRHRSFRTVRDKIVKAKLVKRVTRSCVDLDGTERGTLPCLMLYHETVEDDGSDNVFTGALDVEDEDGDDHDPEEVTAGRSEMLMEVDIAEQVYRAFEKSSSRGLSCPEIVSMLDGGTGASGIEYKRMRSLLKTIEKTHHMKPVQHFKGGACHKRFVLSQHHKKTDSDWVREENGVENTPEKAQDSSNQGSPSATVGPSAEKINDPSSPVEDTVTPFVPADSSIAEGATPETPGSSKKRKRKSNSSGRGRTVDKNLTALGLERREVLLKVLQQEKILVSEKIGRILSESEGGKRQVDVKVWKRIVKTMENDGLCKFVSVAKPRFGGGKDRGYQNLLVLAGIDEKGKEVRDFMAKCYKRPLYPAQQMTSIRRKYKRSSSEIVDSDDDWTPASSGPSRKRSSSRNATGIDPGIDTASPSALVPPVGNNMKFVTDPDTGCFIEVVDKPATFEPVVTCSNVVQPAVVEPVLTDPGPGNTSSILVRNPARGMSNLNRHRLAKLRSLDYGFIVPKMRRARMLHVHLVQLVSDEDFIESTEPMAQSTMEHAGVVKELGSFNVDEAMRSMNVGLVANLFGISEEHGELSREVLESPWKSVPEISENVSSRASMEQCRVLLNILWDLGLLYTDAKGMGFLRGAGVFRDFGKGLPVGSSAYSIPFTSLRAVKMYWNEIESLSNSTAVLNTYVRDLKSGAAYVKEVLKSDPDKQSAPLQPDLYSLHNWVIPKRGGVATLVEDEFIMEMVLQNILVGWEDKGEMPKNISTWILDPIERISVETLFNSQRALAKGYERRRSRNRPIQMCDIEYLVQYSRKRMVYGISDQVIRLSKKPNANITDHRWLIQLEPRKLTAPKKKRVRFKQGDDARKVKAQRLDVEEGELENGIEGLVELSREEDPISVTPTSLQDSIVSLVQTLKLNVLLAYWKHADTLVDGNVDLAWNAVSRIVGQSKADIESSVDKLRENTFLNRFISTIEDVLSRQMISLEDNFGNNVDLTDVPDTLVDNFGEVTKLVDIVTSVLVESSLKFDMSDSSVETLPPSRRKNILRRLRVFMTGSPAVANVPSPHLASKSATRKARARHLNGLDQTNDLFFGLIRLRDGTCPWKHGKDFQNEASPDRVRLLFNDIFISLLDEPAESFSLQSALFFLSRCSNTLLSGIRNEMYEQKKISICDGTYRVFRVEGTPKRPEGPCTAEALKVAASIKSTLETKPWANNPEFDGTLNDHVAETSDDAKSQGAIMAITHAICFPRSTNVFGMKFELEPPNGKPLEISYFGNVPSENELDVAKTMVSASTGEHFASNSNGSPVESAKTSITNVTKKDRVRVRADWERELKFRQDLELSTVTYYESQSDKNPRSFILGIIRTAGGNGVLSHEIHEAASRQNISAPEIVTAVQELLKKGVIHRFGYGAGRTENSRASAMYMLSSFAWTYAVAPVTNCSSGSFDLDWTVAGPISPWTNLNGAFKTSIIESVQVHVLNAVSKRPAIDERSIVSNVLARETHLTERAVLDAISVLFKAGRLRRTIRDRSRSGATVFNLTPARVVPETDVTMYPDGLELAGLSGKYTMEYSQGRCAATDRLLGGHQFLHIIHQIATKL